MKPAAQNSLLWAQDVEIRLQQHCIVTGFSESLQAGEVVGLLGANGSGKTTLLKALAGLLPISAGRISLAGRDLQDWSLRERGQRIAYLSQSRECPWPITVQELVLLGRLPHRDIWRAPGDADALAVRQAMAACEIDMLSARPVTTLSGGELARVLLARTLATSANILLLDEPCAGLDPAHQLHVMTLARQLADQGKAVLVVMHDLSLASRHCHRCWLLHEHRLMASGAAHTVLTDQNLATAFAVRVERSDLSGVVPVQRLGSAAEFEN